MQLQGTLPTKSWYLVYTKPRQEHVALENLLRQGYGVYLSRVREMRKPVLLDLLNHQIRMQVSVRQIEYSSIATVMYRYSTLVPKMPSYATRPGV